jgi:hypothetical protein
MCPRGDDRCLWDGESLLSVGDLVWLQVATGCFRHNLPTKAQRLFSLHHLQVVVALKTVAMPGIWAEEEKAMHPLDCTNKPLPPNAQFDEYSIV